MHIVTGFLSPPVWGTMAAMATGTVAGSLALARRSSDDRRIPLMGVMGAFVFAAQMVNFPILGVPGTSAHLVGGFLLGVLLGGPSGIIVMASVLLVQALVFQDGGLEALGANLFDMGIVPCLLGAAVRQVWLRYGPGILAGVLTFVGGLVSVLAGATSVVVMLWYSGSLPSTVDLWTAILAMDGVHLAVGVVEGAVSVIVIGFVVKARGEVVIGRLSEPQARKEAA